MNITGIKINVTVANWFNAKTNDPVYLGVYSKHGGREFALQVNDNSPFTPSESTVNLVLGQGCCLKRNENFLQIDNSQGSNINSPLLNPIDMDEIEFVYLRKYGGQSQGTDDWGEFTKATVLFCDSNGKLLRFKKEGRLHFANEAGQQHWLTKTKPPRCRVKINLDKIHHKDMAKRPAGYKWRLKWLGIAGSNAVWSNSLSYDINRNSEPDEWERSPESSLSFEIEGCCGPVPIAIVCQSKELDWPDADDIGIGSTSLNMDCSIPNNSKQVEVVTLVNGRSKKRKSKLTYFFTIETECLD